MFALLRKNLAFRRLALAQWASFCGDWFNLIAIVTLLGPEKRDSAFVLAVALVLRQLPVVFLTPVAGVAADKFDRRRIMILCDLLRAVLVLLLILVRPTEFNILLIVTLLTIVASFFEPARTASIPQLVEIEDLRNANALASMFFPLGLLCGAALGGIVTEYGGVNLALLLDVLSFLISALLILKLPPLLAVDRSSGGTSKVNYREFFRTKLPTADHRVAFIMKGLFGLGGAAYMIQLTISSRLELGQTGAVGLSAMLIARAFGALTGGLSAPRVFHEGQELIAIRVGLIAAGVSYVAVSLTDNLWVFLPAIFLAHMGSCYLWVFSNLWMHRLFGNEERGRAFGADFALHMLTSSASTLLAGSIIQNGILSDSGVSAACGIIWLLTAVALFGFTPASHADAQVRREGSAVA